MVKVKSIITGRVYFDLGNSYRDAETGTVYETACFETGELIYCS